MNKLLVGLLFSFPLFGQIGAGTPNCQFSYELTNRTTEKTDGVTVIAVSGGTARTPQINNRNSLCNSWYMSTAVDGFSAISLELDDAQNTYTTAGGTPTSWAAFEGTVNTGTNPTTATGSSSLNVTGFYPWMSISLGSSTGTGSIYVTLYGWKSPALIGSKSGAATGSVYTAVSFSATPTFTVSTSTIQDFAITLTGNVTSSTLTTTNATAGQDIAFKICQDATGSRTFAWPANVINPGSIPTTLSTCGKQIFRFDGTNAVAFGPMINDGSTPGVQTSSGFLPIMSSTGTLLTGGMGVPYGTLPTVSSLTWVNQGGATATNQNGIIYMTAPASSGDSLRCLMRTGYPATPYTFTVGFVPQAAQANYSSFGIVLSDGTKFTTFHYAIFNVAADEMFVVNWSNATTFSAQPFGPVTLLPAPQIIWLQVTDDGANLTFAESNNGLDFSNTSARFTVSRTSFMGGGPTQVGIVIDSNNVTYGVSSAFLSWNGI